MKTKLLFGITLCLLLSSCVDDFSGNGPKEVQLTSENYLSYDSLIEVFAPSEIENINDQIKLSQDEKEITELEARKSYLQNELNIIIDVSKVYGFPLPCVGLPTGKCVPVRQEFFLFPSRFVEATVLVQNVNGEAIGVANELSPLPGFEGELNVLQIPEIEGAGQLTITFVTVDQQGVENIISNTIGG